ncbi:oxysterol-binding protein-related protein 1D-like isoform X2 [Durio zibethinus]|uniref:Oxysterol-binding protein-related protein 1D-like isoform X2 n=1 Tax=Durio zibethinus TaxID=66656 RepID=A0A6P5XGP4_DURZI|nr:oxysterol-binding protein-related protein 1D-like isoform X2 [Durio zibethinus]
MNPLCCIAPVSIDRDRANPVVAKSGPQCQLSIETSVRTVNYSSKPSFSSQVSSINADTDKSSPSVTNHASAALSDEPFIGEVTTVHGVAGILYKWVNYGKGWRSRWFLLEDGVLSYYKVHGPDKILMSPARESVPVIGEDSVRYMRKANWSSNRVNSAAAQCKPFGEIHLKTEKIELETTVVDETKERESYCGQGRRFSDFYSVMSEGSATDSDAYNESQDGVDVETDEDDGIYFDTNDFLSSEALRSGSYRYRETGNDCMYDKDAFFSDHLCGPEKEIRIIQYPYVKRRDNLPEPKEKEKPVGLWSIIKDNIGKDLSGVCLPVYFNEPLSSLQKCFEDLEYSYLVDRALEWGKQENDLMRILNVAAFAVSGYASTEGRQCKPFNPLLGETYEADYPDKGLHFFSEKVSHHPTIVACHCDGRGWKFWADSNLKGKFWGRSIQLDPVGVLTLQFEDGETFQWSKVTTSIYNIILGKIYCDHYGTMRIRGSGSYSCKLNFKEQSIIDRNPHQVHGFVQDNRTGEKVAMLVGKWDEAMYYVLGDPTVKPKGYDSMTDAKLLWERHKSVTKTRYNLTPFAISLNELTPGLLEKLPPTDTRLRPDQRHLENGEYEMANAEKLRLEQLQRQARKLQERGWQPRWFRKDEDGCYRYVGGYWEAREKRNWDGIPDIFGQSSDSPSCLVDEE